MLQRMMANILDYVNSRGLPTKVLLWLSRGGVGTATHWYCTIYLEQVQKTICLKQRPIELLWNIFTEYSTATHIFSDGFCSSSPFFEQWSFFFFDLCRAFSSPLERATPSTSTGLCGIKEAFILSASRVIEALGHIHGFECSSIKYVEHSQAL